MLDFSSTLQKTKTGVKVRKERRNSIKKPKQQQQQQLYRKNDSEDFKKKKEKYCTIMYKQRNEYEFK